MIENNDRVPPGIISKISRLSGKGLLEIKKAIIGHMPVLDKPIFGRLDSGAAGDMLSLLNDLEVLNISHRAYELGEREEYKEGNIYFALNSTKLGNMITSREKSLEQQRVIGRLEDPE
jgi:hypothetical protein